MYSQASAEGGFPSVGDWRANSIRQGLVQDLRLQTFFDYLEGEAGLAEFLEDFPHLPAQVLLVLEVIALFNAGSGANCPC